MAAPAPGQPRVVEIIDLLDDDDEDEHDSDSGIVPLAAQPAQIPVRPANEGTAYHVPALPVEPAYRDNTATQDHLSSTTPLPARGGAIINIDGEEIFIPDEEDGDVFDSLAFDGFPEARTTHDQDIAWALHEAPVTTFNDCLPRVLEIFPDISHEYVQTLYNEFDHDGGYETLPPQARLDNIIEQLVSDPFYPKQEKGKKRKREASLGEPPHNRWESKDRILAPPPIRFSMKTMLKAEFPDIPIQYINDTLAEQKHLYPAYVLLAKTQDTDHGTNRPYGRGRPSARSHADAATIAAGTAWPELLEELMAARDRVQIVRAERVAEEAKKKAEQENLNRAIAAGETAECSACYEDLPMNRQAHCNGSVAHFTCLECMERYIKSEVGESRCRVLCPAGCGAGFAHNQLDLVADKTLLEKLAQLQQEKDIRDADLDDLEECPFCDYKAILPPVEEDFEFRCANPECEKVSCRRCKAISHIPVSCEQHAKDNKINSRHKIEEAMTAALVRSCNKCKKQFIKEYGCNKMTCPSCGNLQCYVCSASLKDYNHFEQNHPRASTTSNPRNSRACPLYDNVEERHEREVKEAEAAARAKVVEENPDVTAEDLEIKVSDAVKQATAERIRRHGGGDHRDFLGIPPPPFGLANALGVFDAGGRAGDIDQRMREYNEQRNQVRAAMARRRREVERERRQVIQPPPAPPLAGQVQNYFPLPWFMGTDQPQAAPQNAAAALPPRPGHPPFYQHDPMDGVGFVGDDIFNDLGHFRDGAADIDQTRIRLPPLGDPDGFLFNRNAVFGQQYQPAQARLARQAQAEQQMQQMVQDLGRLGAHQPEPQQQPQQPQQPQAHPQQYLQPQIQRQQRYGLDNRFLRDPPAQPAFNHAPPAQHAGPLDHPPFMRAEQRVQMQHMEAMQLHMQEQLRQQREWARQHQQQHRPHQPMQPDGESLEERLDRFTRNIDERRGRRML